MYTVGATALSIAKLNGAVNKTAFDYKVDANVINDDDEVEITAAGANDNFIVEPSASRAGEVYTLDLIEDGVFEIKNGFDGKYIFELDAEPAAVEKFDLKLDGKVLSLTFPADVQKTDGTIRIKCIALGLNGTTDAKSTGAITLSREIAAAEGAFSDKEVKLTTTKDTDDNKYNNKLRWNVADLGFSALELKNFMAAEGGRPTITLEVKNGDSWRAVFANNVTFYKADGKSENVTYMNAVTYGLNIESGLLTPGKEYRLILQKVSENVVSYKQEAKLSVTNPTITITPKDGLGENGALMIIEPNDANVDGAVDLQNAVVSNLNVPEGGYVVLSSYDVDYVDVDHELWLENDGQNNKAWGADNFITQTGDFAMPAYDKDNANCQMGKARTIRGKYTLFGNPENVQEFEFKVLFKSAIYSSTPSSVLSYDANLLTIPATIKEQETWQGISAKYAYKPAGVTDANYDLFGGTNFNDAKVLLTDYSAPYDSDDYIVDKSGMPISIDKSDWGMVLSASQILEAKNVYIVSDAWTKESSTETKYIKWTEIAGKDGAKDNSKKALFDKYSANMTFDTEYTKTITKVSDANNYVKSIEFKLSKDVNGVTIGKTSGTISVSGQTNADMTVNVTVTIVDKYNQTMEYEYPVLIKKGAHNVAHQ